MCGLIAGAPAATPDTSTRAATSPSRPSSTRSTRRSLPRRDRRRRPRLGDQRCRAQPHPLRAVSQPDRRRPGARPGVALRDREPKRDAPELRSYRIVDGHGHPRTSRSPPSQVVPFRGGFRPHGQGSGRTVGRKSDHRRGRARPGSIAAAPARKDRAVRKYVIMGVQGSGKGTQAKLLADDLDLVHISVGDIFRWNVQHHTKLGAQVRRIDGRRRAGRRRPGRVGRAASGWPSTTGTTASSSTASRATPARPSSSSRATTSTA